jgi:hypothetical protein
VRWLTDQEGRRLLQIVRRGKHGSVIVTAARTRPEKLGQPFTHLPGPLLRLRPVRAAVDPALPRRVLGAAQTAGPVRTFVMGGANPAPCASPQAVRVPSRHRA